MWETEKKDDAGELVAGGELFDIEFIENDKLVDSAGERISLDTYMENRAREERSGGFLLLDGGSPSTYPRLGLTDVDREKFLDGLGSAISRLYRDRGAGPTANAPGVASAKSARPRKR